MATSPARRARYLAAIAALALAACGGERSVGERTLGRPGDPDRSTRELAIVASSQPSFIPDDAVVSVGDTITFVIQNPGPVQHEFYLGDGAAQRDHEERVKAGHFDGGPNKLDLPPGETRTLTWTFTRPGEVLFGCHVGVPSHYDEGMFGTITIEG